VKQRPVAARRPGMRRAPSWLDAFAPNNNAQWRKRSGLKRDEQQGRVAKLLDEGDAALSSQDYDRAIALYDQVLKTEPGNARAGQGKTGAISARAMAKAATTAPAGAIKRFVSGKTVAQNVESRRADAVPRGFEPSEDVTVHRGSRVTDLPALSFSR